VNVVETLSTSSKHVSIAKFNARVETEFAERFNVESIPNLKLLMIEEAIDINCGRMEKEIVGFITKRIQQVSALIFDQPTLDSFIKHNLLSMN
jgi:thioredoxin-like negative regulator of GroEL